MASAAHAMWSALSVMLVPRLGYWAGCYRDGNLASSTRFPSHLCTFTKLVRQSDCRLMARNDARACNGLPVTPSAVRPERNTGFHRIITWSYYDAAVRFRRSRISLPVLKNGADFCSTAT